MKLITLTRHAKSSWDFAEVSDHNRPLNKRGHRDAPFMGKILREMDANPDLILSSSAVRAYSTAVFIATELRYSVDRIQTSSRVYHASAEDLLEVLKELDDDVASVFLVGHNPALTILTDLLTNSDIRNVPTAGIVCIEAGIRTWPEIVDAQNAKVVFYEYPKKHFG